VAAGPAPDRRRRSRRDGSAGAGSPGPGRSHGGGDPPRRAQRLGAANSSHGCSSSSGSRGGTTTPRRDRAASCSCRHSRTSVAGAVANRPFYAAIGIDLQGHRDVLGVWAGTPGAGESSKYWINTLTELKNRGVADIFYLVCDGLKGMPESVNTVFDQTIVQTCVVDLIRNTFKYSSKRYWPEIARDIKPVYTAVNADAAAAAFEAFDEKWGQRLSGDREAVAASVGQLRAAPGSGHRGPAPAQLHERHRIPERQIQERHRRRRPLPERAGRDESALPRRPLTRPERHRTADLRPIFAHGAAAWRSP